MGRQKGLVGTARLVMLLAPGLVAGCVCNTPQPLADDANLAITQTAGAGADGADDLPVARMWTSSDDAILSFRQGDNGWRRHLVPDQLSESLGGVAAVSWPSTKNPGFFERVYYTTANNAIREGGFDPASGFSWRIKSDGPWFSGVYSSRLCALVLPSVDNDADPQRYVGVVVTDNAGTTHLLQFLTRQGSTFSVEFMDTTSLTATSNVFGAVQAQTPWMFGVTTSGLLRACRRTGGEQLWECETVDHLPEGVTALEGDGAAAAWRDADGNVLVSALVRDNSHRLWEARYRGALQPEGWAFVDDGVTGKGRDTVKAAPWSGGLDAAYVRENDGLGVLQHARYPSAAGQWERVAAVTKPPDIEGEIEGPLALQAEASADEPSRVYMIAQEVGDIRYAFVSARGEERWHGLLDPVVPTGRVTFNASEHFAEACADEKGGHILLAAIRHPETRYEHPAPAQDVRAAWSYNDGHSFRPHFGFPSDYWDDLKYAGSDWIQGDPTAVVLNPPLNDVGYVMFHELRLEPWDGVNAYPTACASRIRLFKVSDNETELVPGDKEDWDLPATASPDECSPETSTLQYLDHPFMAVGPDNRVHIAWYRSRVWNEIPGVWKPESMFYRSLDGVSATWEGPSVQVYDDQAKPQLGTPYVVADPNGEAAYVAWNAGPDGALPPKHRWAVYKCEPSSCVTTPRWPEDEYAHDGIGNVFFGKMPAGEMNKELRSPFWAFTSRPQEGAHDLAIVYMVDIAAGEDIVYQLRFTTSSDGGETWSPAAFVAAPQQDIERFAPSAVFLGDGTLVVTYYEMSPPGSGDNVRAMIAFREPTTGVWRTERQTYPWAFDLGNAVHKNYGPPNELFIGDYQVFTGGFRRVHYLRTSPTTSGNATLLHTAAVSEVCFQP